MAGVDGKYGEIFTRRGEPWIDGEPVFVLRAKDGLAPAAIAAYAGLCEVNGCDPAHVVGVRVAMGRFIDWQEHHGDLVKKPD